MWRIKLQEGKDRPKDATGKWAFPSKFDGKNPATDRKYTKTASLMCKMTEPIHGTGKVVSMDSGFCVTAGILHMHDHGVYGQSLIKNGNISGRVSPATKSTNTSRGSHSFLSRLFVKTWRASYSMSIAPMMIVT